MHGLKALSVFVERLNALGTNYMICGSVASIFYGEPRMTHDIDLVRCSCRINLKSFEQQ